MSHSLKRKIILGGYEAKTCPENIRKNYDPFYKDVVRDEVSPGLQYRFDSGNLYESEIGKRWLELLGSKIFVIPARTETNKEERENLTLSIMENRKGKTVIWNARFPANLEEHRIGEPDALVYAGINKETGKNIWLPVDIKDHKSIDGDVAKELPVSTLAEPRYDKATPKILGEGNPKKSDALQLAHYHRMLEDLGYAHKEAIGGIIGREGDILWHDLSAPIYSGDKGKTSALAIYDHEFNFRVNIAQAALKGIALVGPIWSSECEECPFRTTCHDELEIELDHISLLSGITPAKVKKHASVGITTIHDLASLDVKTAKLVDAGVDVNSLLTAIAIADPTEPAINYLPDENLLKANDLNTVADLQKLDAKTSLYSNQSKLNLAHSIDVARVKKVGKVHLARGVSFVPIDRTTIEEDFDIEDSNGIVYLIGVQTYERHRRGEVYSATKTYHAFESWTHSEAGEARLFAEFWNHVVGQRAYAKSMKWGYRAYYYTKHESQWFVKLAERHAGKEGIPTVEEVEHFFDPASNIFVNIAPALTTGLIWPTENHTLKTLAKWARFSWRDSDPGGGNSMAWYEDAVNGATEEIKLENRKRLKEYNHDDVAAQAAIRDWLSNLGNARDLVCRIPSVSTLDKRFARKRVK